MTIYVKNATQWYPAGVVVEYRLEPADGFTPLQIESIPAFLQEQSQMIQDFMTIVTSDTYVPPGVSNEV